MSFFIIDDQIVLHTSFYVAFCFTAKKIIENYCWILTQLRALYMWLTLSNSTIIVIDMKKDLMLAMQIIFSNSSHLLCIWHINNNVVVNCKRNFCTKKAWIEFYNQWKSVIYAHTKKEFWENWRILTNKCQAHRDSIIYLVIIWRRSKKWKRKKELWELINPNRLFSFTNLLDIERVSWFWSSD
jgi:hypothetical protein